MVADRIVMFKGGSVVQVGTPEEIYHRPNSRYVADFVGNTNVLSATVENCEGKSRLRVSAEIAFDVEKADNILPQGAKAVDVMTRPEYVELLSDDDPGGSTALVHEVELVGQVTALTISVDGTRLRAITLPPRV